jgi:hypothetical protein
LLGQVIDYPIGSADKSVLGNDITIVEEQSYGRFKLSARGIKLIDHNLVLEKLVRVESESLVGHSSPIGLTFRFRRAPLAARRPGTGG